MKKHLAGMVVLGALVTGGCGGTDPGPMDPMGTEMPLAASLSLEAQTAMGGAAGGPQSILRSLVQQVRAGDNAEAKALLARAERMARSGDPAMAAQAHGVILQAVVLLFPSAAARIGNVARAGLQRARAVLGDREAPRIRAALDDIGGLLRRAFTADAAGRTAVALGYALQASDRLTRLQDHLSGSASTTAR